MPVRLATPAGVSGLSEVVNNAIHATGVGLLLYGNKADPAKNLVSSGGDSAFDRIRSIKKPIIAAVSGWALGGGCELALACDMIVASDKAKFGQPEVSLGIIPGFGGTQRLPRRVGSAVARELIYTGKMIDAEEALRIGLANALYEPEELLGAAQKTAADMASKGPLAVAAAKRLIRDGIDLPLPDANRLEQAAFGEAFGTADQSEGMSAFLEKRAPAFKGA